MFQWNGIEWQRARPEHHPRLSAALNLPGAQEWILPDVESGLRSRLERTCQGKGVALMASSQGQALALVSLLDYPELEGWLQTSLFVSPRRWGTGLADSCLSLQWQMACLLGHSRLVISVDQRNSRSVAFHRKWNGQEPQRVWEDSKQRWACRWQVSGPPQEAAEPDSCCVQALAKEIRGSYLIPELQATEQM